MQISLFRHGNSCVCQVICILALGMTLPVAAQTDTVPSGAPQDWSHRHLIYSNPDTREEAAAKGTLDQWTKRANDPRFVLQLEKKQDKKRAAAKDSELGSQGAALAKSALAAKGPAEKGPPEKASPPDKGGPDKDKKKPTPASGGSAIDRDWSNVMGGVSGAGASRMYPAKFAFNTSTKDCASDFVVFTTASTSAVGDTFTAGSRPGTFTAQPTAGQTATVTNTFRGTSIVLTATANVGGSNIGLNFQIGANATAGELAAVATNLANAIKRNGGVVGVTATSAGAVVTITAITGGATPASQITLAEGLGNFTWVATSLTGGAGAPAQPTIFALNQLYADTTANGGCQTSTQAVPATYWAYDTGAAGNAGTNNTIAGLSPVLSFYDNGQQVAFTQTNGGSTNGDLVLLKWSSTVSVGTIGNPTALASIAAASYRTCTAPCMTVLSLGVPNTNSAPFVDYANDTLYVGDNAGRLHKFTGVFNGTPAEVVTAPWPVTVSASNLLSSPVYDFGTGLIFVGSSGKSGGVGNLLHSVDSSTGAVVTSGNIGSLSSGTTANGVRDAPIVDSTAHKVYAFIGADNGAADSLGNTCAGVCSAVYQFSTTSSLATQNAGLGAGLGAKVIIGLSNAGNSLNTAISAGAFDDMYYSSADSTNPSGSLYVCGSAPATIQRPTLWKIGISGNAFAARVQGPLLVSAATIDGCSPVTLFTNGDNEYLYASVTNSGSAVGGGGCTSPANGCMYMYTLPIASPFDTTSTSSTIDGTDRFISVSTSTALNTNEAAVATTLTATQAGTYGGMTIIQPSNGNKSDWSYTLRQNGSNTAITCNVAGNNSTTCTDSAHSVSYAAGDTIDVIVHRLSDTQTVTGTFRVQLTAAGATAALNANGGTGGIIIDNTVTGGGSQVYYSTRTSPGAAVQASQAGLQ